MHPAWMIRICLLLATISLSACGGPDNADDGGAGIGGPSSDDGGSTDKGPGTDPGSDASATDKAPAPEPIKTTVLPGKGVELDQGSLKGLLAVGAKAADARKLMGGDGKTDPELKDNPFVRVHAEFDMRLVFLDKDGDKALSDGDVLNRILVGPAAKAKLGGTSMAALDKASIEKEMGVKPEGADTIGTASVEYWFTKGLTATYENGAFKSVTVYAAQKVIPKADIEYKNLAIGEPLSIKADLQNGTSFAALEGELGAPDIIGQENRLKSHTWLSLGLTVLNAQGGDSTQVIILIRPWLGKLKGTDVRMGSKKADVEKALGKAEKTKQEQGQTLHLYKMKSVPVINIPQYLALIYNEKEELATVMLNYVEAR
ncbi:MAG: hypothetical protein GMKNLPBB_02039 [Myxococcota bacterium]|nr:hypothetical protein [Myxococcota bacterium]